MSAVHARPGRMHLPQPVDTTAAWRRIRGQAVLPVGTVTTNGTGAVHAVGFDWSTPLTVVRHVDGYGTTHYTVRDRYGRHGHAYATTERTAR